MQERQVGHNYFLSTFLRLSWSNETDIIHELRDWKYRNTDDAVKS